MSDVRVNSTLMEKKIKSGSSRFLNFPLRKRVLFVVDN